MSKPIIRIHDLATDTIIDREMTDQEFAEWEIQKAEYEAEAARQAEAEAARQALLDKLGITADEAKLLLG